MSRAKSFSACAGMVATDEDLGSPSAPRAARGAANAHQEHMRERRSAIHMRLTSALRCARPACMVGIRVFPVVWDHAELQRLLGSSMLLFTTYSTCRRRGSGNTCVGQLLSGSAATLGSSVEQMRSGSRPGRKGTRLSVIVVCTQPSGRLELFVLY